MRTFETYIKSIRQKGKSYFTSAQAISELQISRGAFDQGIHKLRAKGDIISPAKGLYIIVPPEHQLIGSIPAEELVPIVMEHWKVPYYACLLTAAMFHGASHQKPQIFQVMTTRQAHPLQFGKIKITFIYKKSLENLPIASRVVRTGYLHIASPELTAVDMLLYPHHAGGLNNIATVLSELIEQIDPAKLIELVPKIKQTAWLQRLGLILEKIDTMDALKQQQIVTVIEQHLISLKPHYVPLLPELPVKGAPRNGRWKIIENATIESDYAS